MCLAGIFVKEVLLENCSLNIFWHAERKSIYIHFSFLPVLLFYSYDWFQTGDLITVVIYTKQKVNVFYERDNYRIL